MKRQCAGCGADMGTKCGKCGGHKLTLLYDEKYLPYFSCRDCVHRFTRDNDGVTHGMCEACMPSQKDSGSHGVQGDPATGRVSLHETAAGCSMRAPKIKGLPRTIELRLQENLAKASVLVKKARETRAAARRARGAA